MPEDDPVWEDTEAQVLLCQATIEAERREELKKQLQFGLDIVQYLKKETKWKQCY